MRMLEKAKKKLLQGDSGSVFKGMLTLLIGAGLARVIGLASIPILARIYSPEDYGVLALYTSFVTVLAPVMTLRYVQAIPLPRSDAMAFNLFALCFKLIVFFSLIVAAVLTFFGEVILGWFNMEALMPWRWLIALGATGIAFYELFSLWATRKKQYKTIAKTQLIQALIGNATKIGLGLLAFKPSGILVGQFISQTAGIVSFTKSARSDFRAHISKVRYSKEKFIAMYYQDFVWFRLPSQFLMTLSSQAPVLMVAALYDKEITGQLSLAMMALSLPVGLIGSAISKAYYAEIAALGKANIDKVTELTLSMQKMLFFIGIPFSMLIYFLGEAVFKIMFGGEWEMAGLFASMLAPFVLFQFTSSPLMELINILRAQVIYLILHAIRIMGLGGLFVFSIQAKLEVNNFVATLSAYLAVFYLLASVLVLSLLIRLKRGAR